MIAILFVSAIQTVSGTQVRENIDAVALVTGEQNRAHWVELLGKIFKFHRTFSVVSALLTILVVYKFRLAFERNSIIYKSVLALLLLIGAQMLSGKVLDNLSFPAQIQSVHLFVGSLICGMQLFITIVLFSRVKTVTA
jgi:cytochrome c oxidase assembly protein subunit 15